MRIVTPRLVLRRFRADDYDDVHVYASDPDVTEYMDWGPNTPADTARYIAWATGGGPPLAVEREGRVIGSVALVVTSEQHRRGELGYVLARSEWGNGYATEAASALLRHAFDTVGLHRVSATCDPANVASARVLEKIGMRREGHLRDYFHLRGEWRDRLLYAATP